VGSSPIARSVNARNEQLLNWPAGLGGPFLLPPTVTDRAPLGYRCSLIAAVQACISFAACKFRGSSKRDRLVRLSRNLLRSKLAFGSSSLRSCPSGRWCGVPRLATPSMEGGIATGREFLSSGSTFSLDRTSDSHEARWHSRQVGLRAGAARGVWESTTGGPCRGRVFGPPDQRRCEEAAVPLQRRCRRSNGRWRSIPSECCGHPETASLATEE
jgi:hypothetical protein